MITVDHGSTSTIRQGLKSRNGLPKFRHTANQETRLHSSRMRTARLGGVCQGEGVSAWDDVCLGGGVCVWGYTPPLHVGIHTPSPWHAGIHPHPVNRVADRCKNTTLPKLRLRAVMISCCFLHRYWYCSPALGLRAYRLLA